VSNTEIFNSREEITPTADEEVYESLTTEELEHRRAMEYAEPDEDENEPEEIHLREAAVSIPSIPKIKSSDGQV
jgi:hypothetical protein